jgi:hypothetical protein
LGHHIIAQRIWVLGTAGSKDRDSPTNEFLEEVIPINILVKRTLHRNGFIAGWQVGSSDKTYLYILITAISIKAFLIDGKP